jgi:hypothetical protein
MRFVVLVLASLVPVLPARAQSSECVVAVAAGRLARAQGLDEAPFDELIRRTCPVERAVGDTFRLGSGESELHNVPEGTRVVVAKGSQLREIHNLPASVRVLDLSDTPVRELHNLPEGLVELRLAGTQVSELHNLPEGLRVLDVSRTPLTELHNLPSTLEVLDVRRTRVTALRNLPPSLRCVVADPDFTGRGVVTDPADCGLRTR